MRQLAASLEDVIVTPQLTRRTSKPRDYGGELQVIKQLLAIMSEAPQLFWQSLAESTLQLCRAGTAGVSLLKEQAGAEVFTAEAVAGILEGQLHGRTIPRASPCGAAIDRNGTQLMYLPERFFSALKFEPPIVEALIIPFHVRNKPSGTVWIVAHDDSCKFDREDERIGETLAAFAAAASQIIQDHASAGSEPRNGGHGAREAAEASTIVQPVINLPPIEPTRIAQELQDLTIRLERRASEKTAELFNAKDQEKRALLHKSKVEQANLTRRALRLPPREMADFTELLNVIQGYTTLIRRDLNDITQLKENIGSIREAIFLVEALIDSEIPRGDAADRNPR